LHHFEQTLDERQAGGVEILRTKESEDIRSKMQLQTKPGRTDPLKLNLLENPIRPEHGVVTDYGVD
jgi:hypothetical protein